MRLGDRKIGAGGMPQRPSRMRNRAQGGAILDNQAKLGVGMGAT